MHESAEPCQFPANSSKSLFLHFLHMSCTFDESSTEGKKEWEARVLHCGKPRAKKVHKEGEMQMRVKSSSEQKDCAN